MMNAIEKLYTELAVAHGVSLNQFCVDAGIHRATLTRWSKGALPSTSSLTKLAQYAKQLTNPSGRSKGGRG
jgi:transcriptional regulator with XRE-family HTH domain